MQNNLKVCVVSHFPKGPIEEGVRKIGKSLAKSLKISGIETHEINISSIRNIMEINQFKPNIIHFVMTPTLSGLILMKIIGLFNPKSKKVLSAIHTSLPETRIIGLFRPDMVLTQSEASEAIFKKYGFKYEIFPNFVDTCIFCRKDVEKRKSLREKFKLPNDAFVILHLASITKERGLEIFYKLNNDVTKVLIIGRPTERADYTLVKNLRESGCTVLIEHFDNIEEIYNIADCYFFPIMNQKACIELPLSILEAMACNLPVITSRFGAIPRFCKEGEGLFFYDYEKDLSNIFTTIKNKTVEIKTRDKVMPYSSMILVNHLKKIYDQLLVQN